jgi:hypothetical protein
MMNKSFMRRATQQFSMIVAMLFLAPGWALAGQILSIPVDTAQSMEIQGAAKDVIIANPAVADVTLQRPDHFVIIGKQPGRTTLLILGPNQEILLNRMVVVSDGNDGLVTVRGPRGGTMSQDSYACAQNCSLIPGSNVGGSNGGGSLGSGPGPSDAPPPGATPDTNKVSKIDTKIKMKISPTGDVTGTRTSIPQYEAPN